MRILKKIWWLPFVVYLVIMPSFISEKVFSEHCRSIKISIIDSASYNFVRPEEIFSLVHSDNSQVLGSPVNEIPIGDIESRIKNIRELESAEVYRTADGVLHIVADQRDPVVRIITSFGNSYYLDNNGEIIPHSATYTPRLIVVSGNITIPDNSIAEGNISILSKETTIMKILPLVNTINESDFWSDQIEQIWIEDDGNVDLIPRVGNHIVKIGRPEDYNRKLYYLETLYSEAMPLVGWNRYREINLMYDGQIVCKKR